MRSRPTRRRRQAGCPFGLNVGAWRTGTTTTTRLKQNTSSSLRWSGRWTTASSTAYSGGSTRWSARARASASYTFTGRSIGFIASRAGNRGRAAVYVDGSRVATIDLATGTARHRSMVWVRTWSTSAKHTVRIVVLGTSGRPRIDVDAFAVLR